MTVYAMKTFLKDDQIKKKKLVSKILSFLTDKIKIHFKYTLNSECIHTIHLA